MIPSFISQDLHQNCRGVSGRLPGPGFAIPVLGAKHLLALLVCALALAGCTGEKAEPPTRTVETVVVGEASDSLSSVYSGQVVARYSSNHAFRVPGMITERLVDVGQPVVAGQILARIDPRDLLVNVS